MIVSVSKTRVRPKTADRHPQIFFARELKSNGHEHVADAFGIFSLAHPPFLILSAERLKPRAEGSQLGPGSF
jgi:hypothetical protein